MTYIQELGRWIAENESLLSGMAALVVLGGVIFSPLGAGLRRVLSRNKPTRTSTDAVAPRLSTWTTRFLE